MHRNYFTLYHAAMELNERLSGGTITGIHSQEKNELILSFTTAGGLGLQLVIITRNPGLCIFTKEGFQAQARHSARLMTGINGQSVTEVAISPSDREITIRLSDGAILDLQLFSSKANILLVRDNIITDAFKEKSCLAGKPFSAGNESPDLLRTLESLALDKTAFQERFSTGGDASFTEKISEALPGFDRTLIRKLLMRAGNEEDLETLFNAFRPVFYGLLERSVTVTEKENGEPEFTLLPDPFHTGRTFESVLDGLTFYSRAMLRFLETKEELKAYRSKLLLQLKKKQKELDAHNPGMLEEIARNYDNCGHLLIASLYQPRKERKSITVHNIFEPEAPEKTIPLKEALTLQENAGEYFSKAAKTRGKLRTMQERHAGVEKEKAGLVELLAAIERITSPKEACRFLDAQEGIHKTPGSVRSKKITPALPFRIVELSPGVTLLVGKNAENNELLTFSHTRPDDIWLHARGASGSHCVIKGAGMDHLDEIKKAAGIAAWYSAAKHSGLVPVIYTLKKFVRRGKKLAVGQVLVEREKVLFVRPSKDPR